MKRHNFALGLLTLLLVTAMVNAIKANKTNKTITALPIVPPSDTTVLVKVKRPILFGILNSNKTSYDFSLFEKIDKLTEMRHNKTKNKVRPSFLNKPKRAFLLVEVNESLLNKLNATTKRFGLFNRKADKKIQKEDPAPTSNKGDKWNKKIKKPNEEDPALTSNKGEKWNKKIKIQKEKTLDQDDETDSVGLDFL